MCYPNYLKVHKLTLLPLCCLLAISCLLHCSVFKVQILTFFQGQIEMLTRLSKHFNLSLKRSGGDKRNRTAGLLLARQALSQLSYTPSSKQASYHSFPRKRENSFTALFLLSKLNPLRWASIWFGRWLAFGGGPKWTRTTDLTIISRAL